jgi:hypothetical protein
MFVPPGQALSLVAARKRAASGKFHLCGTKVGNPALTTTKGVYMDHRGPMKAGIATRPVAGAATPDLIYHVDAISRALKNWNDLEALKLLRLHWREIADAVRELDSRKGVSITVPLCDAPPLSDQRASSSSDVGDGSTPDFGNAAAHDDDDLTAQRRSGSNVRAFPRA